MGIEPAPVAGGHALFPPTPAHNRRTFAVVSASARSPTTILIPGTASLAHLEENIAAATLRLTDAERTALDAMPY